MMGQINASAAAKMRKGAHTRTHTHLKVYNKAKTKQVVFLNNPPRPNVKRAVL